MSMQGYATPPPPAEAEKKPDELALYRAMVSELARAADGRVIMNRSDAHAAIVIEHLFQSAKNEIDILTGELYAPIYGNPAVVTAAKTFVETHPNGRVKILSEQPIAPDHLLLAALLAARPEAVERVVLPDALAKKTPFHFAVADAACFRFEPDKSTYAAYGQFGEPKLGGRLKETFDRLNNLSLQQG